MPSSRDELGRASRGLQARARAPKPTGICECDLCTTKSMHTEAFAYRCVHVCRRRHCGVQAQMSAGVLSDCRSNSLGLTRHMFTRRAHQCPHRRKCPRANHVDGTVCKAKAAGRTTLSVPAIVSGRDFLKSTDDIRVKKQGQVLRRPDQGASKETVSFRACHKSNRRRAC